MKYAFYTTTTTAADSAATAFYSQHSLTFINIALSNLNMKWYIQMQSLGFSKKEKDIDVRPYWYFYKQIKYDKK